MTRQIAVIFFIIISVLGGTWLYFQKDRSIMSGRYDHLGGDFTLQHVTGQKSLKDFQGKPTVIYFGFTTCPDVCPLALNKLSRVLDNLSFEERKLVNKVFVSVDYKRDQAGTVDEYVKFFDSDYIGLTGTQKQIEDITQKYAVHFEFVKLENSALDYTVDHTSRYFLLNKKGVLVNTYSDIVNDTSFLKELKEML